MWKNVILIFILFIFSHETGLYAFNSGESMNITEQDSVKDRQILYNGAIWNNMYHWVDGNQFLLTEFFIPATITINNKTFKNVRIKYDILSDEIITPVNDDEIIQLNKEMVMCFLEKLYN